MTLPYDPEPRGNSVGWPGGLAHPNRGQPITRGPGAILFIILMLILAIAGLPIP